MRLNKIPLYYTSHFIYSSINGHLASFYLLAIVNNAVKNICVQVSIQVLIFNSFESLEKQPNHFPQWLRYFKFPPARHKDSNLSTSSPTLGVFSIFFFLKLEVILVDVKWYLIVVFNCIFPMTMIWGIFSCDYWSLVHLLWRNVYSNPCPFFNWTFLGFFNLKSNRNSLYILSINLLSDIWFANTFSHSVGVSSLSW